MAYTFRYSLLNSPAPRSDGFGIDHDIEAYSSDDGTNWIPVPGGHRTVVVPTDELEIVMDMPNTGAKVTAYKQVLVKNRNTHPVPIVAPQLTDFDLEAFQEFLPLWTAYILELENAQDAAIVEADRANDYITVTLGKDYPVDFSL
jgi:hypothetical protein